MSLAYALFQDQNPPPAAPGPSYQKSKRIGCITAGNCVADVWQKHFRRNTNYEKRMAKEGGVYELRITNGIRWSESRRFFPRSKIHFPRSFRCRKVMAKHSSLVVRRATRITSPRVVGFDWTAASISAICICQYTHAHFAIQVGRWKDDA